MSTSTIKRLAASGVLSKEQAAPWAPREIGRADMESDAVQSIIRKLKQTGKLDLEVSMGTQWRTLRCLPNAGIRVSLELPRAARYTPDLSDGKGSHACLSGLSPN